LKGLNCTKKERQIILDKIKRLNKTISEIRDQSSILEIVSDYVRLKKVGKNYKGLCPFHFEETPSFMVNEEKQIFHCFGCGEGGDVFTFLRKVGFLFPDGVEELSKKINS
jgi:DNA primase